MSCKDVFRMFEGFFGPYYTPHIDEDGNLSWTNSAGLPNPPTINIKGEPGTGLEISGMVDTAADLPATAEDWTCYLVGTEIPYTVYTYNPNNGWMSLGQLASGPKGDPGPAGPPGADGFSPEVQLTPIRSISPTGERQGVQITVTKKDDLPESLTVWDGAPGATGPAGSPGAAGADGYSPTVAITEITDGHRVTVTDKTGEHNFDVLDGAPGPAGPQGEPGAGVPSGGTAGQVLTKTATGTAWQDPQGSGGTSDYNALSNKPSINGNTLQGNKTAAQLGLVAAQQGAGLITDAERQQIQTNADDIAEAQGKIQQQGSDLQQLQTDVDTIEAKIPTQASAQNKLADKDFVNSSINSSTAFFRGAFASRAALLAVAWQTSDPTAANYVSNNDYAYVADDESQNDEAWRYIYVLETGGQNNGWQPQFRVNESPLTAAQLAALNSGATAALIAQITANQNAIGQKYTKPSGGIPKSDLASAVQTSLGKADTALQSVPSTYRTAAAQDTIDAGKIDKPSNPASGAFLVWNGTAWAAQTLATWQGGNY